MKKILLSIAAILAAATFASAQSMADATEIAKLANESLSAGDLTTALSGFQEALTMAQACGEEGEELVETCKGVIPQVMLKIAKQEFNAKNYSAAIDKFTEAAVTAGQYGSEAVSAEIAKILPNAYLASGNALLNAKDYVGAEAAYAKVLELDPVNGNAALRRGMALEALGRADDAIEAYKLAAENGKAADANAKIGKLHTKRASEALKAKKYAESLKEAETALEYTPDDATTLNIAGTACAQLKKNADAVKYFEKYLEVAPNAKNAEQVKKNIEALK